MTYKGARHGYVFDAEPTDSNYIDALVQANHYKMKKEAIAATNLNVKANTEYFNSIQNLNYTPQDDGFKTYSRITKVDTVGKIKFPWDK